MRRPLEQTLSRCEVVTIDSCWLSFFLSPSPSFLLARPVRPFQLTPDQDVQVTGDGDQFELLHAASAATGAVMHFTSLMSASSRSD